MTTPNIYKGPPLKSKEEIVAAEIDYAIRAAAEQHLAQYRAIYKLTKYNPTFKNPDGSHRYHGVLDAFARHTSTGLTRQQLEDWMALTKTFVNRFAPNTIADETPELKIGDL
jgi:hypothetical protein